MIHVTEARTPPGAWVPRESSLVPMTRTSPAKSKAFCVSLNALGEPSQLCVWPYARRRTFTLTFILKCCCGDFKVEGLPLYWGHLTASSSLHESEMGSSQCSCEKMRIRHTLYFSDRRQLLLERALGHLGAEIWNGMVSDTCHGHL